MSSGNQFSPTIGPPQPPAEQPRAVSAENWAVKVDPIHTVDPRAVTMVDYVRYDEAGRIRGSGSMGRGVIQMWKIQGDRIIEGYGRADGDWVDDEDGNPTIKPRPVLALPATLQAGIGREVTLPALPACTIVFNGPIRGTQEHAGGDCKIGFMVPGTYSITGDPFPAQRFTLELKVG